MPRRKKKAAETSESDDEIIVICHPVGIMIPTPGSRRVPCSSCNQIVWFSAATERHVAGKPYRIQCDECVSKLDDDDVQVMPVAPGQIEEMLAALPDLSRIDILKRFPDDDPEKRKAALQSVLREGRRRRRTKN